MKAMEKFTTNRYKARNAASFQALVEEIAASTSALLTINPRTCTVMATVSADDITELDHIDGVVRDLNLQFDVDCSDNYAEGAVHEIIDEDIDRETARQIARECLGMADKLSEDVERVGKERDQYHRWWSDGVEKRLRLVEQVNAISVLLSGVALSVPE